MKSGKEARRIVRRTSSLDIYCAVHNKSMPGYDTAHYVSGAKRPHLSEIPDDPAV
jgi:hypothetical protein